MGFWDDRLIGQLQGFLTRRGRNLSINRVANEYSRDSGQMLRVHVSPTLVVDIAEFELQWMAIAVDIFEDGTLEPLGSRRYIPLGHYYDVGTRDVANMVLGVISELDE